MGPAVGHEYGVAGRELVDGSVLGAQDGGADGEEVEIGASGLGVEGDAEPRPRLDAPVSDAAQSHAGQQLTDEVGRQGEPLRRPALRSLDQRLRIFCHSSS